MSLVANAGAFLAARAGIGGLDWVLSALAIICGLGMMWLVFIRPIFVPGLELLPEGQEGRGQRGGRKAFGLGKWLVTLVLGAALGQLIVKWLG